MSSHSGRNSPPDQPTNDIDRDLYESNTHPFIVKIWLEETAEEAGRAMWRGHITHVPSGERRYVQDLDEVVAFIVPYLEGMGVNPGKRWRVGQWLKRWKRYLTRRG